MGDAGRDPSELYRGARLAAALEWADAAGDDAGLNRLEREFLEESRSAFARANRRLRALLAVAVLLLVAALVAGASRARGARLGETPGDGGDRAAPRRAGARRAEPRPLAAARARGHQPRRLGRDAQQPARRASAQPRRDRGRARGQRPTARRGAQPRRPHARCSRRRRQRRLLRHSNAASSAGRRSQAATRSASSAPYSRPAARARVQPDGRTLAVGDSDGNRRDGRSRRHAAPTVPARSASSGQCAHGGRRVFARRPHGRDRRADHRDGESAAGG